MVLVLSYWRPGPSAENVNPVSPDSSERHVSLQTHGGLADFGENWTIGDLIGTDNDGDNLYDGADPDCAAAGTPGEVGALLVSAHDPASGTLTISYSSACSSSDSNYYFGSLAQVAALVYSGQPAASAPAAATSGTTRLFLVPPLLPGGGQ